MYHELLPNTLLDYDLSADHIPRNMRATTLCISPSRPPRQTSAISLNRRIVDLVAAAAGVLKHHHD